MDVALKAIEIVAVLTIPVLISARVFAHLIESITNDEGGHE